MMLRIIRVTITFSENGRFQRAYPKGRSFSSIAEANSMLISMAVHGPTLGYDKTDFEIEWEDRYIHTGRYDLKRLGERQYNPNGCCDLGDHVRGFFVFCSGVKPQWMEQKKCDDCVRWYGLTPERQQAAKRFLAERQLS